MLNKYGVENASQSDIIKNKKMTKAKFKEKLMNIAALSMQEQQQDLEKFYDDYKGNEEQIDDVCVLGIRV